jgi:hypothetical protein
VPLVGSSGARSDPGRVSPSDQTLRSSRRGQRPATPALTRVTETGSGTSPQITAAINALRVDFVMDRVCRAHGRGEGAVPEATLCIQDAATMWPHPDRHRMPRPRDGAGRWSS